MLVSHFCHFYSKDASVILVDEGVEFEEVMFFYSPGFAAPEENVNDVLNKNLVFEFELCVEPANALKDTAKND